MQNNDSREVSPPDRAEGPGAEGQGEGRDLLVGDELAEEGGLGVGFGVDGAHLERVQHPQREEEAPRPRARTPPPHPNGNGGWGGSPCKSPFDTPGGMRYDSGRQR